MPLFAFTIEYPEHNTVFSDHGVVWADSADQARDILDGLPIHRPTQIDYHLRQINDVVYFTKRDWKLVGSTDTTPITSGGCPPSNTEFAYTPEWSRSGRSAHEPSPTARVGFPALIGKSR